MTTIHWILLLAAVSILAAMSALMRLQFDKSASRGTVAIACGSAAAAIVSIGFAAKLGF